MPTAASLLNVVIAVPSGSALSVIVGADGVAFDFEETVAISVERVDAGSPCEATGAELMRPPPPESMHWS